MGELCRCCTGYVEDVYGTTTDELSYTLGDCGGEAQANEEDWGPATAVVAGEKAWTPGPRIIIPITDEGPRCGGEFPDGADIAVIEEVKPIARDNRVIVGPLLLFSPYPCVGLTVEEAQIEGLATELAHGAYPGGKVFRWTDEDLATALVDFILSACPKACSPGYLDRCVIVDCDGAAWCGDCNYNAVPDWCDPDCDQNNVPDECDIAEGTLTDCNDDGGMAEQRLTSGEKKRTRRVF